MDSKNKSAVPSRRIYLPLRELGECAVCHSTKKLLLCAACGERVYCSAECQSKDWKTHKLHCGKTDLLDLGSFYPLLAYTIDLLRCSSLVPMPRALCYKLLNSPNPGSPWYPLSDGLGAKLLILGDKVNLEDSDGELWWPTAASPDVRKKLIHRIQRDGNLLPLLTATCISLLSQIYTTTSGRKSQSSRIRLQFENSPVADFGIAYGSVRVNNKDKLAYFHTSDHTLEMCQDSTKHYWMYFTNVRGKEVFLDCGLFIYNYGQLVVTPPYAPPGMPQVGCCPAFYRDKLLRNNMPSMHREKKRFSVLRNTDLHHAVTRAGTQFTANEMEYVYKFMESLSGRKCSEVEKSLTPHFIHVACGALTKTLETQRWKEFPANPDMDFHIDPGDMDDDDKTWDFWQFLQNWKKMKKEGKLGNQTIFEAMTKFESQHETKRAGSRQ